MTETAKKTTARRTRKAVASSPALGTPEAEAKHAEGLAAAKTAAKRPARRTPAKKTTVPQHVKDQAAEVEAMVPAAPAKKTAKKAPAQDKKPVSFDDRDWTYINEKPTTSLHETLAKLIEQRADVEITPKQVQAVLAMHPHFQRSNHNKTRAGYVPLAGEIVEQRSIHMKLAHKDAAEAIAAKAPAKPVTKKVAAKKAPAKRSTKTV
jgi:hypothetical protein